MVKQIVRLILPVLATSVVCCACSAVNQPSQSPPAAATQTPPASDAVSPTPPATSQVSPLTAEQARAKYGLDDPPSSNQHTLSKANIKHVAGQAGILAGAAYVGATAAQREKVNATGVNGAKNALEQWRSLDPDQQHALAGKATGLARKASALWKKLPNQ